MLPPLASLRAFAAVARTGSVTRAAADLGLSQPAISQHLRQLEAFLDLPLVSRNGGRLALTEAGRDYGQSLARAFAEMESATARCLAAREFGVITLSLVPTLATRWLIPRLATFHEQFPDIEVRLATATRDAVLEQPGIDLAIQTGASAEDWPGYDATFLMADACFPVMSAAFAAIKPVTRAADLAGHVWLEVKASSRAGDWSRWLAAAGMAGLRPKRRLGFDNSTQALAAARAGLGVALAHRPFVLDDLKEGSLVAPLDLSVPEPHAYWLVRRAEVRPSAKLARFCNWLTALAATEVAG